MMTTKAKKPFIKRLWWKIVGGILLFITLFWLLCWALPRPKVLADNPMMRKQDSAPMLIAHGGGNREFPDNTIEAFYNAYSVDKNAMMETDVSITRDGVVILSHDTTLSRKTNYNDFIINVDYSKLIADEIDFNYANSTTGGGEGLWLEGGTLKKYTNFEGVEVAPTDVNYAPAVIDGLPNAAAMPRHSTKFLATSLELLLRSFPNNYVNVEIKQKGETGLLCLKTVLELMTSLENEGISCFNRVVIASFHREVYAQLLSYSQDEYKSVMYSPEKKGVTNFYVLQLLGMDIFYSGKVSVLQLPMWEGDIKLATKTLISNAHRHNIAVHYWTINEPDDMRYLYNIGADGIMTDLPHLYKQVIDAI